MKKYLWGNYLAKRYSLLEVDETTGQIVLRPVGSNNHVTLHQLIVLTKTKNHYTVKFQGSNLNIPKNTHSLVSYNWNSPAIKGVWSDTKVAVAKKLGFKNPDKHATSAQGILVKLMNSTGYDIGAVRVELNQSSSKSKYLRTKDKIGEIGISDKKFMVRFILSANENPYKGKADFSIDTQLGRLNFLIEDVPIFKLRN